VTQTEEPVAGAGADAGVDAGVDAGADAGDLTPAVADAAVAARVRGRRVLVTGAASGIGRDIATALRLAGAQVLGVDRDLGDPAAPCFQADLASREGNEAAVAEAQRRLGGLDALVPCAGFQSVQAVPDFDPEVFDRLLAVMLTSPFLLARAAWPALTGRPGGRYVAVASAHALVASPYKAGYVAAKHGLLGLVKTLALEGATHGLSATAVCPGFVRTPLLEGQLAAQAERTGVPESGVLHEVILAPHAVKRLVESAEVVLAVLFLLGPGGAMATGSPLVIDGGWTAR